MRDVPYWASLVHELCAMPHEAGWDAKNSATASRLIKEALGAGVIRLQDPNAPPKTRRYLPHWA